MVIMLMYYYKLQYKDIKFKHAYVKSKLSELKKVSLIKLINHFSCIRKNRRFLVLIWKPA